MWKSILKSSERTLARRKRWAEEKHKEKIDDVLSEDEANVMRLLYKTATLLGDIDYLKANYDLVDFLQEMRGKLWDRFYKEEEKLQQRAKKRGLDADEIIEQLEERWRN